jgi:hypothetical protein
MDLEVGPPQLQRHGPAGQAVGPGLAGDLLAQRPQLVLQVLAPVRSSLKVVSALIDLRSLSGSTARLSRPWARACRRRP